MTEFVTQISIFASDLTSFVGLQQMVLHRFQNKMERKTRREVGSEICVKVDFYLLKPRFISIHCLIKSNHDFNDENIIISPGLCPHMSSRQ